MSLFEGSYLYIFKNRYFRTIFLAIFAATSFIGSAIFIFDADPITMLQFFVISLVGLVVIVITALIFTALRLFVKAFLQR